MTPPLFPAQKRKAPPERLAIDAVTRQSPIAPSSAATPEPAPPPFTAGALNKPPSIPMVEPARSTAPLFAAALDAPESLAISHPPSPPAPVFTSDFFDAPRTQQAPPSPTPLFTADALDGPRASARPLAPLPPAPLFTADTVDGPGADALPQAPLPPAPLFTADTVDGPEADALPQAPLPPAPLFTADTVNGPGAHALPQAPLPPGPLFTADALDGPGAHALPQTPPARGAVLPASTFHARPVAPKSTSFQAIHARPASLWRRVIATLVDAAILGGIVAAYLVVAARIAGAPADPAAIAGLEALVHQLHAFGSLLLPAALLAVVLGGVYAAAFALVWGGRTPGRWIVGIRLVDASGYAPGPWRAVVRAVLSLFSFGLLLAGFWLALFDRRGQTLHDKLTRTFLVQPS